MLWHIKYMIKEKFSLLFSKPDSTDPTDVQGRRNLIKELICLPISSR